MIKNYTIVRKRVVTQVMTIGVQASSQKDALAEANECRGEDEEVNEWYDLGDVIKYPKSTTDDILEAEVVEVY
jgi:hypothetical protein